MIVCIDELKLVLGKVWQGLASRQRADRHQHSVLQEYKSILLGPDNSSYWYGSRPNHPNRQDEEFTLHAVLGMLWVSDTKQRALQVLHGSCTAI